MTYLCTGSNSSNKAVNRKPIPDKSLPRLEQLNWRYETGDCMDCGHTFKFVEDPSPKSDRLVLPPHYEDGTVKEPTR
jgi:hypothetical protein